MYAIRVKEVRFFKIYFANLFDIRVLILGATSPFFWHEHFPSSYAVN